MAARIINVRFCEDAGPENGPHQRYSRKTYSYKSELPIKVDDIVVVRTYGHCGPLRLAKVVGVGDDNLNTHGYPPRHVIQVVDMAAAAAEELREKEQAQAREILKRAQAERSQQDLFREVAHVLSDADRELVARTLGVNPAQFKPQATDLKGARQEAQVYRLVNSEVVNDWKVKATSLEEAVDIVWNSMSVVPRDQLTARWL